MTMKHYALVAALVCCVVSNGLSQAKPGGVGRQIAMGGAYSGRNAVFNPFIFQDPAWVLINPAYQHMYRDYVWLNVAGGGVTGANGGENVSGSQFGGLNVGFGKEWAFGAILSYDPSYANSLLGAGGVLNSYVNTARPGRVNPASTGVPTGTLPPVDVFEALASYHSGDLSLGFGLLYGWTNKDYTSTPAAPASATDAALRAHVFGLRAGVILDLGSGSAVEGSAAARFDGATDTYTISGTGAGTGTSEYTASATEIQANLRGKFRVSNKVNFIPYGGMMTISATPKEASILTGQVASTFTSKTSTFSYVLGAGAEYSTRTFYLAGGVSIASGKTKTESSPGVPGSGTTTSSSTISGFPVFNLGGEWWWTEWLAGRAGYYRAFGNRNVKTEPPTGGTTIEGNLFSPSSVVGISGYGPISDNSLVTLGLGLKFAGFALDATVSEEALRRGLGLLGSGDNINTFGYINLSYCFE
jgi:hypothetical protein